MTCQVCSAWTQGRLGGNWGASGGRGPGERASAQSPRGGLRGKVLGFPSDLPTLLRLPASLSPTNLLSLPPCSHPSMVLVPVCGL